MSQVIVSMLFRVPDCLRGCHGDTHRRLPPCSISLNRRIRLSTFDSAKYTISVVRACVRDSVSFRSLLVPRPAMSHTVRLGLTDRTEQCSRTLRHMAPTLNIQYSILKPSPCQLQSRLGTSSVASRLHAPLKPRCTFIYCIRSLSAISVFFVSHFVLRESEAIYTNGLPAVMYMGVIKHPELGRNHLFARLHHGSLARCF